MRQTKKQYEENTKKLARHCYNCQEIFWIKPSKLKNGYGKFCSKKCEFQFGNSLFALEKGRGEYRKGKPAHPNSKKALLEFSRKPKSEEHKKKIALAQIGQRLGKSNPRWKGGMVDITKTERNRNGYRLWKLEVFKRADYACAQCGSKKMLCAHHVHSFTDFPEIGFYPENGICLCKPCHWQWHWGDRKILTQDLDHIKRREFGEPFDASHGNTEPSRLMAEGVETMHGAPISGEDIVQTTNA